MKNIKLLQLNGFKKETIRILNNKCPFCACVINKDSFKDELSKKEFEISGLCQKCQDKTFNEGDEEDGEETKEEE